MSVPVEIKTAVTGAISLGLLGVIPPSFPQGEGGRRAIGGEGAPVLTGATLYLLTLSPL